ncbi:MAG: hypothetical protein C4537_02440 [Acholeplasma sp.]|jgi:hypothetical protein|nr:MAG: hypothetical protein C4537_02440 [Acholeplasma sp.]
MKNLVKFKFEEKEGFLSVVTLNGRLYTLAQKDTPKVKSIEATHTLMVSSELKVPSYQNTHVHVIYDKNIIKEVYAALEVDNNLYFKQLDDTLCVLELFME